MLLLADLPIHTHTASSTFILPRRHEPASLEIVAAPLNCSRRDFCTVTFRFDRHSRLGDSRSKCTRQLSSRAAVSAPMRKVPSRDGRRVSLSIIGVGYAGSPRDDSTGHVRAVVRCRSSCPVRLHCLMSHCRRTGVWRSSGSYSGRLQLYHTNGAARRWREVLPRFLLQSRAAAKFPHRKKNRVDPAFLPLCCLLPLLGSNAPSWSSRCGSSAPSAAPASHP